MEIQLKNIGHQVLNIIKNQKLFNLYSPFELDFNFISLSNIIKYIKKVSEEEYNKLNPELNTKVALLKFITLPTEQFAKYYYNNVFIFHIFDIQINYIIFNLYLLNYNNK